MKKTTEEILKIVSDFKGKFNGAFNIREDGQCAGRQSSENIKIEPKDDAPGINIIIVYLHKMIKKLLKMKLYIFLPVSQKGM